MRVKRESGEGEAMFCSSDSSPKTCCQNGQNGQKPFFAINFFFQNTSATFQHPTFNQAMPFKPFPGRSDYFGRHTYLALDFETRCQIHSVVPSEHSVRPARAHSRSFVRTGCSVIMSSPAGRPNGATPGTEGGDPRAGTNVDVHVVVPSDERGEASKTDDGASGLTPGTPPGASKGNAAVGSKRPEGPPSGTLPTTPRLPNKPNDTHHRPKSPMVPKPAVPPVPGWSVAESLEEVRNKVQTAVRDVTTFVEQKSGLKVDDSASDLEQMGSNTKQVVAELPRNASAVLRDAKQTTESTVDLIGNTVLKTLDTVRARRQEKEKGDGVDDKAFRRDDRKKGRKQKGDTSPEVVDEASVFDSARKQRKAERKEALGKGFGDVKARVERVTNVAAGGVRSASAAALTGIAHAKEFMDKKSVELAENKEPPAKAVVDAFTKKEKKPNVDKKVDKKTQNKQNSPVVQTTKPKKGAAPEPKKNKESARDLDRKKAEDETAKAAAEKKKKEGKTTRDAEKLRKDAEKLQRHQERERKRQEVLKEFRERDAASQKKRTDLKKSLGTIKPERVREEKPKEKPTPSRKETPVPKDNGKKDADTKAQRAEEQKKRQEKEAEARAAKAEAREARAEEERLAERVRKQKEEQKNKDKPASPAKPKESKTSKFTSKSLLELPKLPKKTGLLPKQKTTQTKLKGDTNNKNDISLKSLLTMAGVAATAGVAARFMPRGGSKPSGSSSASDALTPEAHTVFLTKEVGLDVLAGVNHRSAHVTLARRDTPSDKPGLRKESSAKLSHTQTESRKLDVPARVGPPLRIDAAWRALGRRVRVYKNAVKEALAKEVEGSGDEKASAKASTSETTVPPESPATAAARTLSPVEEAVRLAELAATSTPAVAPYRKYDESISGVNGRESGGNASTPSAAIPVSTSAVTPAERRDAAATGVTLVTPESTPLHTPRMTPTRPQKALDFDTIGAVADLAVLEALTPRGTPGVTPIGTPTRPGRPGDSSSSTTPPHRQFTAEEYARAVTKLEGKKEALFETYRRMEQSEGRGVNIEDFETAQDREAESIAVALKMSPRRPTQTRPSIVPALKLDGMGGGGGGGNGDSSELRETRETDTATEESSTPRRAELDAVKARKLVANGVEKLEHPRESLTQDKIVPSDDPSLDPSLHAARATIARLHKECQVLEGRVTFKEEQKQKQLEELTEREKEIKLKFARKAVRHLSQQLKRRAVLAWVLYLDAAVKERRILKKCAMRMKMRTTSSAFEAWLEYGRLRREHRAEKRVRELQKRAADAEKLEMEARKMKAAAAAKAAETASLVADAEAREQAARAEVDELKMKSAKKGTGTRPVDSSDDEDF